MKPANPAPTPSGRRIAGRAQLDHILDPYQRQQKPGEPTVCRQCGAVYHRGRWSWSTAPAGAHEDLCSACRRANDKLPAGIVTLSGAFARAHKDEIISLARHQEEVENKEHPLNRILDIRDDGKAITIETADIHLPRRIGEAIARAFHGALDEHFDEQGYFLRVTWHRD